MHKGAIGTPAATLQRLLQSAGFKIPADGWFGDATEAALLAFQHRAGLVADGIAGPKTLEALQTRVRNPKHLSEQDLAKVAARLGVDTAAIKAVNTIESAGRGFNDDGRPVILYERHIAYKRLQAIGADADFMSARYPNLINQKRGGYLGGPDEWSRLTNARQVTADYPGLADECCSWGQYQIMGYHWLTLGYTSSEQFVASMHISEAFQLDAFARFIEADPALHKALKAKKWPDFARIYNGPAYKENNYDTKLARAYARYSTEPVANPEIAPA